MDEQNEKQQDEVQTLPANVGARFIAPEADGHNGATDSHDGAADGH